MAEYCAKKMSRTDGGGDVDDCWLSLTLAKLFVHNVIHSSSAHSSLFIFFSIQKKKNLLVVQNEMISRECCAERENDEAVGGTKFKMYK